MTLSKLELQQMLREMNVKFDAEESTESLKERLDKENHRLWLKSVSQRVTPEGKTEKNVIRKRKKKVSQSEEGQAEPPGSSSQPNSPSKSASVRSEKAFMGVMRPAGKLPAIEKPKPGKPWKEVADGTEPFNRKKKVFETVLRRSGNACELCEANSGAGSVALDLQPYHILPLDRGGEHSIKNVVALCVDCMKTVGSEPDPKTLKKLKLRTRLKLYDAIKVEKRVSRRSRRRGQRFRRK